MGPDDRLSPIEPLNSMTHWGTYQHDEDKSLGSLKVGKLADTVILEWNPDDRPNKHQGHKSCRNH